MPEVSAMVTVGDTQTTRLPRNKSASACMVIASSAAATFTAIPEVTYDDATWAALTLTKSDNTTTASVAAVGTAAGGWARVPGAIAVRWRLSAITTPSTGVVGRINTVEGI